MIPPEMREAEALMTKLAAMQAHRTVEYWTVQNTGWSAGVSWFAIEVRRGEPQRFESEAEAREYIGEKPKKDLAMKWRIVHVEIVREPTRRVTTETFIEVPA